jgi:hypothetical protein
MSEHIAKVVAMLVALNAAVMVVMIPLSFIVSVLALNGLEKFDLWLRHRAEKRSPVSTDETA